MNKAIEDFIKHNSYFELRDEPQPDIQTYGARKYAALFDETFGQLDLEAADKLKEQLLENFNHLIVDIDTFEEWVLITAIEIKN